MAGSTPSPSCLTPPVHHRSVLDRKASSLLPQTPLPGWGLKNMFLESWATKLFFFSPKIRKCVGGAHTEKIVWFTQRVKEVSPVHDSYRENQIPQQTLASPSPLDCGFWNSEWLSAARRQWRLPGSGEPPLPGTREHHMSAHRRCGWLWWL